MHRPLGCLLLLLLALLPAAVPAVELTPGMNAQLNATGFEYWIEEVPLSGDDMMAQADGLQWQKVDRPTINLHIQKHPVWVRFPVHNTQAEAATWFLLMPWIMLSRVELHVQQADGHWRDALVAGYQIERDVLPLNYRLPVFPLQLGADEKAMVYLRVSSKAVMFLPLLMKTPEQFDQYQDHANIAYGLGFGILLAMMLYNLSLFIFVRDRTYLFYSLYVFSVIFYELALTGYGMRYLWGDFSWIRANAYSLSAESSFLMAALFGRKFLRLVKYGGWYLRLNNFLLAYWTFAIICNVLGWIAVLTYTANLMALITCVIGLGTAIALWRKGNGSARYFTIAWTFIILSTFIVVLMMQGAVPFNVVTEGLQMMAFAIELLLLSFALAEQINRERQKTDLARQLSLMAMRELSEERKEKMEMQAKAMAQQKQHNEELELRVLDRTAELERTMKNLELANRELAKLSVTDPLTRLNNRRYFDETLQAELSRAVRIEQPLALILVDIDHFKSINDRYGHLVGDECLKLVAATLKTAVNRSTDLVARYGGEEFAVVLPATSEQDAVAMANRIRAAIEDVKFIHGGKRIAISASLGVAGKTPTSFDTPGRFITAADEALYRAKEAGRNQVVAAHLTATG